jgi:hypothetical protein
MERAKVSSVLSSISRWLYPPDPSPAPGPTETSHWPSDNLSDDHEKAAPLSSESTYDDVAGALLRRWAEVNGNGPLEEGGAMGGQGGGPMDARSAQSFVHVNFNFQVGLSEGQLGMRGRKARRSVDTGE